MATTVDLIPNADVTTNWIDGTGSTFAEINSGVDTPNDTTYIALSAGNSNVVAQYGLTNVPADYKSTIDVTIKVRHRAETFVDDNDTFTVGFYDDGGVIVGSAITATRSDGAWANSGFTEPDWNNMTQTAIDGGSIRFTYVKNSSGMPDTGREIRVSETELLLNYAQNLSDSITEGIKLGDVTDNVYVPGTDSVGIGLIQGLLLEGRIRKLVD